MDWVEAVYVVKSISHRFWFPLLYVDFISNLFVAEEPKLIVGLPSFTALYIVISPATMLVVAPAAPNEVNPANVSISASIISSAKVVLLLTLPSESTTRTLVSVVVDRSSK